MHNLKSLGSGKTEYKYSSPHPDILEVFPNPRPGLIYDITHEFHEYTSLCPITGQPDFATIILEYVPDTRCVETKSLKLYYFSYRNEGAFMEEVVNKILDHLVSVVFPLRMSVTGKFGARGGIYTTVRAEYKK